MRLTIFGRDPQQVNVVITSDYVSSYHAELIQLDNGDMYIVDKSTNGTYINGVRINPNQEYPVRRGDNIMLADTPLDWSKVADVKVAANVKRVISIGSNYINEIKVQGPQVSRFHATIRQTNDGKWAICDHSKNGTTVNGRRIAKDTYVAITSKDQISCAGIPIQNPVTESSNIFKIVGIAAASVCLLVGLFFGMKAIIDNVEKKYTDQQLAERYEQSVVFFVGSFHYEVTCGNLDISKLPDPRTHYTYKGQDRWKGHLCSKFTLDTHKGRIVPYEEGEMGTEYSGTGFFIGEKGVFATNRHVARPWESEYAALSDNGQPITWLSAAEEHYKALLADLYEQNFPEVLPYISQVKIHGVLDHAMIIPNETYLDNKNIVNCHVIAVGEGDNNDLALFQIRNSALPAESKYIPLKRIKNRTIKKGQHMLTIGFPFGFGAVEKDIKIQANVSAGNISKDDDPMLFRFTAPTFHGASGSPVFDEYGYLIGVLNSGNDKVQGFNNAVRVKALIELLEKAEIKE